MKASLRPCPFCGGEAELMDHAYNSVGWNEAYYSAYVYCTVCHAKGKGIKLTECYGPPDGTVEDAINAWNRRAIEYDAAKLIHDLYDAAKLIHDLYDCYFHEDADRCEEYYKDKVEALGIDISDVDWWPE